MAQNDGKPNGPKAVRRMTFWLDYIAAEEIGALAAAWGCSRSEAVRRVVHQAVRTEEIMRPVLVLHSQLA